MRTRIDLTQQPLWQRVLVMVGLALVIQVPPLFLFAVRQAGSQGARWGAHQKDGRGRNVQRIRPAALR